MSLRVRITLMGVIVFLVLCLLDRFAFGHVHEATNAMLAILASLGELAAYVEGKDK